VALDIDEIYDKIGTNYPYTYEQFLENFTPKLAERLIEIISIREHNDYCYNAMMHGQDMKKHIIEQKVPVSTEKISEDQRDAARKYVANMKKRGKHV
jgi:hypothetical protein